MSTQRLSRLQKWVLEQCLNGPIRRAKIREFYGKKFSPSAWENEAREEIKDKNNYEETVMSGYVPKKKLISTMAIEASISRSLSNLLRKKWLKRFRSHGIAGRHEYRITDAGHLQLLKVKNKE